MDIDWIIQGRSQSCRSINEVQSHDIGIITRELCEVLPAKELEKFHVGNANDHRSRHRDSIEACILKIVSAVANETYAAKM